MRLDKVILKHGYGQLKSRAEANISVLDQNGLIFDSPIILSNMPSVQNIKILDIFNERRWPYIYHRLGGKEDILNFLKYATKQNYHQLSISVGVQPEDIVLLNEVQKYFLLDWLTIDVAFIYNKNYINFIKQVREMFPNVYLIAGNFTDPQVLYWLKDLGVNAAKFSIGVSNLCRTRQYTGFGTSLNDLIECGRISNKIGIDLINDGGLTILDESKGEVAYGDIFKVFNFGAKWQMSSSLFRWVTELANENGEIEQYGNSTARAKGHDKNVEGDIKKYLTNGINLNKTMDKIEDALKSSISYAGINDISLAYNSVKFEKE